jgi:dienelactone hydrolase
MRKLIAVVLLSLYATSAFAAPRAEKISWKEGGKDFDGYLIWDDSSKAPRPGLVEFPNWWGVTDAAVAKAKTLAGKDYVILLADVYGRGLRPKNPDEAGKASGGALADEKVLRARAAAALAALKGAGAKAPVDTTRIGAIGFCFGGAVALDLARSGADVKGVATFHANLSTKMPAQKGVLKAAVLAMNGADDKFVSHEQIHGFYDEMRAAGADWQFVQLGGAVHCFAEPDEHNAVPGCNFNAAAYKRSLFLMHGFFNEAFAKR